MSGQKYDKDKKIGRTKSKHYFFKILNLIGYKFDQDI